MLRVESHPVIAATFANRILRDLFVCRRVDLSDNVLILQVYIDPFGDWIVPGITRLTLKMQSGDDDILIGVHYGQCMGAFVGNVDLVKWWCISNPIRL